MSSDEALHPNRTIRWLCENSKMGLARMRFEKLVKDGEADNVAKNEQQLYKEVFEVDLDGSYLIHDIFIYATGNDTANGIGTALALSILEFSKEFPSERRKMLSATEDLYGGTPLHLAVFYRANVEIIDALVRACPEALLRRRDTKTLGERTPLELCRLFWSKGDSRIAFLEQMTASWICHRHRLSIHLCANRYFGSSRPMPLVPFSNSDREVAKIKPKRWFVLSVIGYLLQREMKPIALQILAFAGGNAKVATSKKRRNAKVTASKKRRRAASS